METVALKDTELPTSDDQAETRTRIEAIHVILEEVFVERERLPS